MTAGQGTVKWMAPEVLSDAPYTDRADIYSFSLIIWELLMEKPFFEEYKFNSQIEIQVVNHGIRPPLSPLRVSPELRNLITRCWDSDPKNRPSSSKIVNILNDMDVNALQVISPITTK